MKKRLTISTIVLASCLVVALAGCSSGETTSSGTTSSTSEVTSSSEVVPSSEASLSGEASSPSEISSSSEMSLSGEASSSSESSASDNDSSGNEQSQSIDYMALVNKLNPLPEGWEDALTTQHMTNSIGDDVEVETKAYDAYLKLKADLEKDGIFVDLDSARRSIADQQRIMDEFTAEYGADYAKKTVATPGYSEHHTGLALDLYLIIDGVDIVENEDMIQHPDIWAKIHAKLADYGFILRYLDGREHITGYGYEPWHIRYIDDPAIAKDIMDKDITFEEYLGAVNSTELTVDLGESSLYSQEDLAEAAIQVKCEFATFAGCELHNLRYAGDECNTPENLAWMNSLDEGAEYTQVAEFLTDFHSPKEGGGAWNPDQEYTDYQWWLARTADGGWQLLTWGY